LNRARPASIDALARRFDTQKSSHEKQVFESVFQRRKADFCKTPQLARELQFGSGSGVRSVRASNEDSPELTNNDVVFRISGISK
jgi:hypothetical protein